MRALIVDDSRFVRSYLRRLLEKSGFECDEAADGVRGLGRLRLGKPFDLLLLDVNMPGIDGMEVLKQIRAGWFGDLKVMMVTTESEKDSIACALDAGADEYLMKPFDARALEEKLALLGLLAA